VSIGISVDDSEVHDLAHDILRNTDLLPGRVETLVQKTGYDMEAMAKVLVPVDTGFLMGSISIEFYGLGFDLGPTASYGDYVERGVPHPWVITAAPGGTLHFMIDGHSVFAKSVVHPPMAPQPYLSPAFDAGLSRFVDALGQLGEQVVGHG
jgi:hypothetical protein